MFQEITSYYEYQRLQKIIPGVQSKKSKPTLNLKNSFISNLDLFLNEPKLESKVQTIHPRIQRGVSQQHRSLNGSPRAGIQCKWTIFLPSQAGALAYALLVTRHRKWFEKLNYIHAFVQLTGLFVQLTGSSQRFSWRIVKLYRCQLEGSVSLIYKLVLE